MQCPIHNEPMTERDGKWGKFWSHKTTDEQYESGWCSGKPVKKDPTEIINIKLDKLIADVYKLNERLDGMASFLKRMQVDVAPEVKPSNVKVPF